jgi:hypothetical protein
LADDEMICTHSCCSGCMAEPLSTLTIPHMAFIGVLG